MATTNEIEVAYRNAYGRDPTAAELQAGSGLSVGQLGDTANLGGGGRTNPIDLSQVPSVQGYVQGQFAGEDVALKELVAQMRSREQPLDIYSRLETESGVPELRQASRSMSKEVASLEDAIYGIEGQTEARTRESLMTEGQRGRLVTSLQEPLRENLAKVSTALGRTQQGLSEALAGVATKVGLALEGQKQSLEAPTLIYQTLVDRNARSLAGFTADRETTLNEIILNWQRGNEIQDSEWELANQLASEERNYIRGLQETAATFGKAVTGSESANELLTLISSGYAEKIAYERKKAAGDTVISDPDKYMDTDNMDKYINQDVSYGGQEFSQADYMSLYGGKTQVSTQLIPGLTIENPSSNLGLYITQ